MSTDPIFDLYVDGSFCDVVVSPDSTTGSCNIVRRSFRVYKSRSVPIVTPSQDQLRNVTPASSSQQACNNPDTTKTITLTRTTKTLTKKRQQSPVTKLQSRKKLCMTIKPTVSKSNGAISNFLPWNKLSRKMFTKSWKLLREEYDVKVSRGICLPVDFGSTSRSLRIAVDKQLKVMSHDQTLHQDVIDEQKLWVRVQRDIRSREDQEKLIRQEEQFNTKIVHDKQLTNCLNMSAKNYKVFCKQPVVFDDCNDKIEKIVTLQRQPCENRLPSVRYIDDIDEIYGADCTDQLEQNDSLVYQTRLTLFELKHSLLFLKSLVNG